MHSPRPSAWILSITLVMISGCKEDNTPVADPLDDPWVDAIEADEEPMAALPSAEPSPDEPLAALGQGEAPALAEPDSNPEAQPAASVLATPAVDPPAAPANNPTPPNTEAELPAAVEAPAVEDQPRAPVPIVEPTPAPSTEPASPPPITSADFHGNFRFVGGSTQRDDLTAAIEATVTALNRALHGIARRRLTATNPLENTVEIVVAGDKVTTSFESGFNATCVIDGPMAHAKDIEGGKLEVRLRWKDGKLIQQMQGKGGARTIVYVLSADRKKLTVHTKITSDRLPVPLIYRLSYVRK